VCRRRGYHTIPPHHARDLERSIAEGGYEDPEIGRIVDRYLIVGKIGQGGMGAVYLALQLPLEREVALKMIPGVTLDDTSRRRFEREAKAISILYHPNIVQLFEYGFSPTSGAPFMAMEYVRGGRELMDEILALRESGAAWAAGRVARIFGQVLSALQTAHRQGLVHRDIKPHNVMLVDVEGNPDFVKILDFGLARTLSHVPGMDRLTGTGTVVGTPQYMAPEQLVAGRDVDSRSDLYSVGAVLFEVVTGRSSYPSLDPRSVLALKLDPDYDPLERISGTAVQPPLAELLARSMARDPDRRFESAAEMRAALEEALAAAPPLGRPAPAAEPSLAPPEGEVDPEATTLAAATPGTMEISSFERPSSADTDLDGEELVVPPRAPMKVIAAGALTGVVLAALALAVIFVVLPALDARRVPPAADGASAAAPPPGDAAVAPTSEPPPSPELSWVTPEPAPPEDEAEEGGTGGAPARRKKKHGRSGDGQEPTPPAPEPEEPPELEEPPEPEEPPGPEEPPEPPTALVEEKLAKLEGTVAACLSSPQGKIKVSVVVDAQTGRPESVSVGGFYPGGDATTRCIEKAVKSLSVGSFPGQDASVTHVYDLSGEVEQPAADLDVPAAKAKMKKARGWVVACSGGRTGEVRVEVTVEGETGDVVRAVVTNHPFAATPEGDCIEKAIEKMLKFPPFAKKSRTFSYTFSLVEG
jgi:serine/threonine-protein kinase